MPIESSFLSLETGFRLFQFKEFSCSIICIFDDLYLHWLHFFFNEPPSQRLKNSGIAACK